MTELQTFRVPVIMKNLKVLTVEVQAYNREHAKEKADLLALIKEGR